VNTKALPLPPKFQTHDTPGRQRRVFWTVLRGVNEFDTQSSASFEASTPGSLSRITTPKMASAYDNLAFDIGEADIDFSDLRQECEVRFDDDTFVVIDGLPRI
jgi:hypothetical protein